MFRNIAICLAMLFVGCNTAIAFPTTFYGVGDRYAGQLTASGEVMDPSAHKAAHPYLPIGTVLTVCWEGCVDVVVNDRGSTLDLTPAAASAIGMMEEGIVDAEVIVH